MGNFIFGFLCGEKKPMTNQTIKKTNEKVNNKKERIVKGGKSKKPKKTLKYKKKKK